MNPNSFGTMTILKNFMVLLILVLCCWTSALSKPSHLYASGTDNEGTSTLYRLNVNTGAAKPVGIFSGVDDIHLVGGLAFDTDSGILYSMALKNGPYPTLSLSGLYTVDVKTAIASLVGVSAPDDILFPGGLAYDSNQGVLYATGINSVGSIVRSAVYTVDPLTGIASVASVFVPYDLGSGGLAYDPAHDLLYATGTTNMEGISALFVINVNNHSTNLVGYQTPDAFLGFGGLAFDSSNGILYATGYDINQAGSARSFLYVVDPTTGEATKVGPTGQVGIEFGGLTFVSQRKADFVSHGRGN